MLSKQLLSTLNPEALVISSDKPIPPTPNLYSTFSSGSIEITTTGKGYKLTSFIK